MKNILALTLILSCSASAALAATSQASAGKTAIDVGVRVHSEHSEFDELPYGDGDTTFVAGVEFHDTHGYWQFAVGYTPRISDKKAPAEETAEYVVRPVDYAITPQANLVFKDRGWQGGVGILSDYIVYEDGDDDWTDVYYQFLFGYAIATPRVTIELMGYYPFESWGDLGDFDFDDLEYGAALKFFF
jgi:hypothetical protein